MPFSSIFKFGSGSSADEIVAAIKADPELGSIASNSAKAAAEAEAAKAAAAASRIVGTWTDANGNKFDVTITGG